AARCRFATAVCREQSPGPENSADGYFRCFHPVDGPGAAATEALVPIGRPAEGSPPIVAVSTVQRAYPLPGGGLFRRGTFDAVAEVSLTVERCETFGIVGESGCGKSTLARMLVGLDQPTAGTVAIDGRTFAGPRTERRTLHGTIQLMFQ